MVVKTLAVDAITQRQTGKRSGSRRSPRVINFLETEEKNFMEERETGRMELPPVEMGICRWNSEDKEGMGSSVLN